MTIFPKVNKVESSQGIFIQKITPEIAKSYLQGNNGNFRPLDKYRVRRYAKEMKQGEWTLTGDTIKITNGQIVDGQHRLQAIVEAGVPIETAVAINIAESSFHIDRGKPRTLAQWLNHSGHKNANTIAAAVKLIVRHDQGFWGHVQFQRYDYTDGELIDYANAYKHELQAACKLAANVSPLLPRALATTLVHIGSDRSATPDSDDLVSWFWHGLMKGSDLEENSPPLVLRNRLVKNRASKTDKLSSYMLRMLATIAWNKTVTGENIGILRLRLTGPAKENPPNEIFNSRYLESSL